ncbi:hypothetical protein [Streptomyces phaeochromogenes]|uniref:hypothetical protein n=1 Tax=Streptomyces phaeochromogenes TaxID=1923 RepID=UPI002DD7B4E5|nr:hypothetical protein [Streptomyces phaeochromogenes]WRZ31359.1 hypothetical protein OG931_28245 [Streptomyces phaeochromogenes]
MTAACGLCGEQLQHGYLCHRHALALAERLEQLPALFAELAEHLVPRRSGFGELVTASTAGPRSPVNEDVIDLRQGGVVLIVESWRTDVQRVRWPRHSPPPIEGGMDRRVLTACRWLGMELEWIAEHYTAAGELAREVRELEGGMLAIVGDPPPRPQRLGTCIAVTDDQGTVCGAPLTRLPGQTLRCRQCRTAYRNELDMLLLLHYQPRESA